MKFEAPEQLRTFAGGALKGLIGFGLLLVIWQVAAALDLWSELLLPSPSSLIPALYSLLTEEGLFVETLVSGFRVLIGSLVAILIAVPLGGLVASNAKIAATVEDFVFFLQSIGAIGWLPMLILWFGYSEVVIIVTVAYTVFFPVYFGVLTGISAVPRNLFNGVKTLGGSKLDVVREVAIPGSMPALNAGIRTGIGFGWRTVIFAEIICGRGGLGDLMFRAQSFFAIKTIMVIMIVIGVAWLIVDTLVLKRLESVTINRWSAVR